MPQKWCNKLLKAYRLITHAEIVAHIHGYFGQQLCEAQVDEQLHMVVSMLLTKQALINVEVKHSGALMLWMIIKMAMVHAVAMVACLHKEVTKID